MAGTGYLDQAAIVTLPAGWTGAAAPILPQAISGTGATEATQLVALNRGRYYRLTNNTTVAVRYAGAQAAGLSNVVNNTLHPVLPGLSSVDFWATPDTLFVYAEAADGASAYALSVYENDVIRAL